MPICFEESPFWIHARTTCWYAVWFLKSRSALQRLSTHKHPNCSLSMEKAPCSPLNLRPLATLWMHGTAFSYPSTKVITPSGSSWSKKAFQTHGARANLYCASSSFYSSISPCPKMAQSDHTRWQVRLHRFTVITCCFLKVNVHTFLKTATLCKLHKKEDQIIWSSSSEDIRLFCEHGEAVICSVVRSTSSPLGRVLTDGGEDIELNCSDTERYAEVAEGGAKHGSDGVVWMIWSVAVIVKAVHLQSCTYEVKS